MNQADSEKNRERILKIEAITEYNDFLSLKNEWNELLSNNNSNTIFLTWEWLFNWWKVYKQDKKLWILLIRDEEKLVGIAPFYISKVKYFKLLRISQVRFLGSDEVGSDYLDFIIESNKEKETMKAILGFLRLNRVVWDLIKLTDLPGDSKNLRYLQDRSLTNGYYFVAQDGTTCPYIPLPGCWDTFLGSLRKNMRYSVRRGRRRLNKDYKIEFSVLGEREELDKAIDDLIRLSQMRMNSKRNNGAFLSEKFTKFHQNIIPILFDKGFLRLCFIKVNGSPISVLYIFKYNQKYSYYQSGLDPKWYRFSPGMVLSSYCIENAISEGMSEFDFLQGEEDYKYKWTSKYRKNIQITILKDSLRGRIIFWAETSRIKGKKLIKRILKPQPLSP